MSIPKDGGPAFPSKWTNPWDGLGTSPDGQAVGEGEIAEMPGMSLRQYAAIKLKVPDSGDEWLDEMIRKSQRDDLAAQWLNGYVSNPQTEDMDQKVAAQFAYYMADVMLEASKGGAV